ncbi:MAG: hypothetical protein COU10_01400 [Candidatus Harrisonbacteria bacterium CG10_big_fil_rev_8_21_14_0_10_45_28]|uniref:ROK family protein n=1 Tax=Candidatus Harrisonbacteria bacterium CG10_big_fil_rev_8_21_14_0_10_45_28 TaxID=1974586 RepID=A0A2H0UNR0_9BACT|nr:MAG: hypothetical protein COU10_01400 [Candidatus Harrisonbacteria bacterium CG10_big_fil_rev_8_21_14_0_10_45_28]
MTHIGVDIGGSKIRIIKVRDNRIVRTIVLKTPKTEAEFVSKIKAQFLLPRQARGQQKRGQPHFISAKS